MFEFENGTFDIQKKHINGKGEFVITAGLSNNGILGKSDVNSNIITEKTITVDMFGNAFFRNYKYKLVTHARVFSLVPKIVLNEKRGIFISSIINKMCNDFDYENMCSYEKIKNKSIKLPMKNKKIDFDFMESYISELEARHISELEAYLNVTGLKDYKLTDEEEKAIHNYKDIDWKEYRIGDLFEKIKTKKLPYKAKDLPTEPQGTYNLPCLTSSFRNQGLNYYAPRNGATILKNVISIPSNSDVYRAYFQSKEFTVLSDAYAIKWKDDEQAITDNQYLFMVAPINKVTDLPIYSYKKKLGGWNVVKEKKILLPHKNGNIDFDFLDTFIWAIKKTLIKKVVKYIEKR